MSWGLQCSLAEQHARRPRRKQAVGISVGTGRGMQLLCKRASMADEMSIRTGEECEFVGVER